MRWSSLTEASGGKNSAPKAGRLQKRQRPSLLTARTNQVSHVGLWPLSAWIGLPFWGRDLPRHLPDRKRPLCLVRDRKRIGSFRPTQITAALSPLRPLNRSSSLLESGRQVGCGYRPSWARTGHRVTPASRIHRPETRQHHTSSSREEADLRKGGLVPCSPCSGREEAR